MFIISFFEGLRNKTSVTVCKAGKAMYYGAADTVTALAFMQVDELIDFIKKNSMKIEKLPQRAT